MNIPNPVATYALRLGDNGLVLAQRLGAWCGHAPELEIDLALANIGHTRAATTTPNPPQMASRLAQSTQ